MYTYEVADIATDLNQIAILEILPVASTLITTSCHFNSILAHHDLLKHAK